MTKARKNVMNTSPRVPLATCTIFAKNKTTSDTTEATTEKKTESEAESGSEPEQETNEPLPDLGDDNWIIPVRSPILDCD